MGSLPRPLTSEPFVAFAAKLFEHAESIIGDISYSDRPSKTDKSFKRVTGLPAQRLQSSSLAFRHGLSLKKVIRVKYTWVLVTKKGWGSRYPN